MRSQVRGTMRGLLRVLAPILLPAFAQATVPGTETFDFEDCGRTGPSLEILPPHYLSRGLRLTTDGEALLCSENHSFAHTPPNVLAGVSRVGPPTSGADSDVIVRFYVPETLERGGVASLSFWAVDSGDLPDPWTATVFDVDGAVLDEIVSAAQFSTQVSFDRPQADIHRLVFSPSTDWELFDTLAISEIVAVPEPSHALLALLWPVPFAARRCLRRRRRERRRALLKGREARGQPPRGREES